MKKLMDKLLSKIKLNKKIFVFLIVIFFIAFISGSILFVLLDQSDKTITTNYLNSFMNTMLESKINYFQILTNSLISSIILVFGIWLLGISVIGIPVILFLYFSQVFTFGFMLSSIFLSYKFKGGIFAFIYTFPHYLIFLITLLILTTYSILLSIKLITAIIQKKQLDFKLIFNKYLFILLFSIVSVIICSLCETFVFTNIIKLIAPFFK